MNVKNLIFQYFKERINYIGIYIIFIFIFSIVFYLYSLPLETIMYATLLCAFFSIIFTVVGIYKYYQRDKKLQNIKYNISHNIDGLPHPQNLIEKDYQGIIKTLYKNKIDLISERDKKHTDLIEYFTLWTHQIKTPISAAHLILQSKNSYINEDIEKQLFEIEEYVDMALQYLRLENISSDLKLEEYSLLSIIKKSIKSYSKIFIYKNIKLNLKENDIKVITDEKWLLFVIKQILSNALKYTYKGEIYIEIDNKKVLTIKDTGIGISKEDIARIFERGFTGYNGRMNKKSTGLGLYLSKNILDKLNHKISIISEIGIGTTVKIDLSSIELEIE